jgi:hypothetical protein
MSVATKSGLKVILPRTGPNVFWDAVKEVYATDDAIAWRQLAMLTLKESIGWPESLIATVFGQRESEVAKTIDEISEDVRKRFTTG